MKSGVQEQNTNNISERRKDSGKIAMKSLGSKLGSFERYHLRPLTADLSPYTVPLPFFLPRLDSQPQPKSIQYCLRTDKATDFKFGPV